MGKPITTEQLTELMECLQYVEEPRVEKRCTHNLIEIMVIGILATLCGAEGIRDIHSFAFSKEDWLKQFLELSNGIPSEDTFARVLSIIDPTHVEVAFREWVKRITKGEVGGSVAIDGKYTRGTDHTINKGNKPLLVVTAFSSELNLVLAEAEGQQGSESDGATACLEMLSIKGVLVSVDAGLATTSIIEKILIKGGDYIAPVKGNRRLSRDEIGERFLELKDKAQYSMQTNEGHARGEVRHCYLLPVKNMTEKFMNQWPGVEVIFAVQRERVTRDKRYLVQETGTDGKQSYRVNENDFKYSEQTTYYVSSRKLTAEEALKESRDHWGIENKVHWVLDVAFREDDCLIRAKKLAKTLSLIRKYCLNIIRGSKTTGSIRTRMKKSGWNNDYLEKIVFG